MSLLNEVVPQQYTGQRTTAVTTRDFKTFTDAAEHFGLVSERLMNVNAWHELAGAGSAKFQLYDAQGNEAFRSVQENDYFQIDVPGPGSSAGDGKDWVRVVKRGHKKTVDEEILYFTVRTSAHPLSLSDETAHFFGETASSTFVVYRDHAKLLAGVFGRNEKANKNSSKFLDRLRNVFFAVGAWLGLSKVQWKALTHGLIQD